MIINANKRGKTMFNSIMKQKRINELEMEIDRLKARKETEELELKHLVKMKEEKMQIELDKKAMEMEKEKNEAIAKVKDEYRDKLETRLIKEGENIKEMYNQILQRLPNINAKLSGKL